MLGHKFILGCLKLVDQVTLIFSCPILMRGFSSVCMPGFIALRCLTLNKSPFQSLITKSRKPKIQNTPTLNKLAAVKLVLYLGMLNTKLDNQKIGLQGKVLGRIMFR